MDYGSEFFAQTNAVASPTTHAVDCKFGRSIFFFGLLFFFVDFAESVCV